MNRKKFITAMAVSPLTGAALKVNSLRNLSKNFEATEKFPVLFLGHGSPMNAIEENEFVDGFRNIGKTFQKPKAILVISAHWETRGTFVTAMDNPPTIHDFGGFPQALFDVQYPAPGSPELAQETKRIITKTDVLLDDKWGLDHGAWSVVKHLYPDAEVPVIQMSIDYTQPASYHYELAQELASLRHKGVLIIGSGNMVHNLRMVAWDKLNEAGFAWDWLRKQKKK
ncbi:4,5-DOPA dioxygenase extradiol [Sphingobacterium sp. IITKGP-BTPF85]|uniref:4,5-DOPA-extradiol-dioxygenase n=1 Tax=Sphingobacterium sp. IITKGP-BTPF85 TaxID=1338009 RepID=UPI001E6598CF|nr:4,5-DOPA dioxygenase extradiol [Sphingobacterium sp. IITKGP-BTPF85]